MLRKLTLLLPVVIGLKSPISIFVRECRELNIVLYNPEVSREISMVQDQQGIISNSSGYIDGLLLVILEVVICPQRHWFF